VSLGIFSIVIVTASGVILSIINSNKKNQAISSVVNNLNYSIESMVRDIKTGYKYQCNFDPSKYGVNVLVLENYKTLASTCSSASAINNLTLISTITGKEQLVKYEIFGTLGLDAFIRKTLYTQDNLNVVSSALYPLTDQKNITLNKLQFTVNTPHYLIPVDGSIVGQPSVFLILSGTAKVNQVNISDFFIQTYISQRLPNFI
jgi:type II secretory pathway pseudopilin PulG